MIGCLVACLASSICHAAITVEDAYAFVANPSFEHTIIAVPTQVTLSSVLTVPTGAGDDEHLVIGSALAGGPGFFSWPQSTPDNGITHTHIGFWIAITNPDIVVDTGVDFFSWGPNDGLNSDIALQISSTGGGTEHVISVLNANGTSVSDNPDLFEDDTWYWLDLYYKRHDSTGFFVFFLTPDGDDTRNFIDSGSSIDFDDGSAAGGHAFFLDAQHDASHPFGGSSAFHIKNVIIEYGIVNPTTEGTFRVASLMAVPYKVGNVSDDGDNMVGVGYVNIGDNNLATNGQYTSGTGGGIIVDDDTSHGIAGPTGQFGDAVTALGCKWTGVVKKGFSPTGNFIGIYYGKYDGGFTTATYTFRQTTGAVTYLSRFENAAGARAPDIHDDHVVVGGQNDLLAGNMELQEARGICFSSFPYDESAGVSLIDRVPFGAQQRAERVGG